MFTAPADHAVVEAVIKVKVIKVIKHFHTRLFPIYIYSVPPESLMTLMTMTLMTGRERIFHSCFFTLNNVIMCYFYIFICTFA